MPGPSVSLAEFGIPPAQRSAVSEHQLLALETAAACLAAAGYGKQRAPGSRVDVWCGAVGGVERQYANAFRIEAVRALQRLNGFAPNELELVREEIESRWPGSAHDRIGEMASSTPARIAIAFGYSGRTVCVDASDATSHVIVTEALRSLRQRRCDAALVLAGQRQFGCTLERLLAAKGLLAEGCSRPFYRGAAGFQLAEGYGALLLKRASDARTAGDQVIAYLSGAALAHDGRPGSFRYSTSSPLRDAVLAAALEDAGLTARDIQYAECTGTGFAEETRVELQALADLTARDGSGALRVGCIRGRVGHPLASAGLLALARTALALQYGQLPPDSAEPDPLALPSPSLAYVGQEPEPWPALSPGRRGALVLCSSMAGTVGCLALQEAPSGSASERLRPSRSPSRSLERTVAVVSYAGRFADSPNAAALWTHLQAGRELIRELPEDVFPRRGFLDERGLGGARSYTNLGSHLPIPAEPPSGIPVVPARFATMDRAPRLALHVAHELLTRAGARRPNGRGLVVIASNLCLDRERLAHVGYEAAQLIQTLKQGEAARSSRSRRAALLDQLSATLATAHTPSGAAALDGMLASGIAASIVNEYRLNAVPVVLEAACASSLAALDVAQRALQAGAYDYAIAGGVEFAANLRDLVLCSALGLLSRSRIRPFHPRADGFSPGDGMALFLLRPFGKAEADGAPIHAVLRGVGASNDARSMISPHESGQVRAIQEAFQEVDFGPESVQYLEAHGTGTELGDQTELRAIRRVYGAAARRAPLIIGSIKAALGHTFAAAGAAGLLHAILALQARAFPRTSWSVHEGSVEPRDWDATRRASWLVDADRPRRAAVSSFGTGGINYHVLLEEHRRTP